MQLHRARLLPKNNPLTVKAFAVCAVAFRMFFVLGLSLTPAEGTDRRLKVGVIGPLTGQTAAYGTAQKNGIELAREEHRDLLDNVDFFYEDDQYDAKKSINAFFKLVREDEVDLVFAFGAVALASLAPLAETSRVPFISLNANPQAALGRRYTIRFTNYSGQYIAKLLEYLRAKNFRKICMVRTEIEFLTDMANQLQAQLKSSESLEVVQTFLPNDYDFRSTISRLKHEDCDTLGVYLMFGQISKFYIQARQQELQLPTFGTNFFESHHEITMSQGSMEGAVFPHNEVDASFQKRYMDHFGDDSEIAVASRAYDFASLVGALLSNEKSRVPSEEILARFRSAPPKSGATGMYRFMENSDGGQYFEFPVVVKQIQNGKFISISLRNSMDKIATDFALTEADLKELLRRCSWHGSQSKECKPPANGPTSESAARTR